MSMDDLRRADARKLRRDAAELAFNRLHEPDVANGEEKAPFIANFTKGLRHDANGILVDSSDYVAFVDAIESGNPEDWRRVRHAQEGAGGDLRGWESPTAGHVFDLQGPDARSYTMPPAPRLQSNELAAEVAEVYLMALLRDVPFAAFSGRPMTALDFHPDCRPGIGIDDAVTMLKGMPWFMGQASADDTTEAAFRARRRFGDKPSAGTVFRGNARGDRVGPYLSQFLLSGSEGIGGIGAPSNGKIRYGALRVDQRVRVAKPGRDYMQTWQDWLDVQNGVDERGRDKFLEDPGYRFMATPRDLATYVHYDALYEAYLNALLQMLANGLPFDAGLPYSGNSTRFPSNAFKQQAFAQFGGPHILSLLTEVATRALKAVRHQKFGVHRRGRPERMGGLVHLFDPSFTPHLPKHDTTCAKVAHLHGQLAAVGLLDRVKERNGHKSLLLPMAFPEGSPMHPSYGAGHATVAGACVTILKAWFDTNQVLVKKGDPAFVPSPDGRRLDTVPAEADLTVEGELNKLAANIAIGRNWAGVHYFTDYAESMRLGERIALGILEEQGLCYIAAEKVSLTVPLFYPDEQGRTERVIGG